MAKTRMCPWLVLVCLAVLARLRSRLSDKCRLQAQLRRLSPRPVMSNRRRNRRRIELFDSMALGTGRNHQGV